MSEPTTVAFVIDRLRPGAGTENQLILLLEHFDKTGIQPHLVCLKDDPAFPRERINCPVHILHGQAVWSPNGLRNIRSIRRLAKAHKWQLMVTMFRDGNILGTLGGWVSRVPVVSSRRNMGRGYWHTRRELMLLKLLNRLTAGFVSNSSAVRDYTIETEGVDASRIQVIPNAVVSTLRSAGPGIRWGISPDHLIVGCVANFRAIKGVDVLVRAFSRVHEALPEAHLVLVGEGEQERLLRQEVEKLGLEKRVHFTGSHPCPPSVLSAFDVAVLPSHGESSSNALLEYLQAGLPVVATDVGGNAEAVHHGTTGLLIPPQDEGALAEAILSLLRDQTYAQDLGSAGRNLVEARHGLDDVLDLWMKLVRRYALPNEEA